MQTKRLTLINKLGLHARAAVKLVNTASRFQSEILLTYNNREINAKSVMNLMIIGAPCGAEIEFSCNGDDEVAAMKAVEELINDRFGESE